MNLQKCINYEDDARLFKKFNYSNTRFGIYQELLQAEQTIVINPENDQTIAQNFVEILDLSSNSWSWKQHGQITVCQSFVVLSEVKKYTLILDTNRHKKTFFDKLRSNSFSIAAADRGDLARHQNLSTDTNMIRSAVKSFSPDFTKLRKFFYSPADPDLKDHDFQNLKTFPHIQQQMRNTHVTKSKSFSPGNINNIYHSTDKYMLITEPFPYKLCSFTPLDVALQDRDINGNKPLGESQNGVGVSECSFIF